MNFDRFWLCADGTPKQIAIKTNTNRLIELENVFFVRKTTITAKMKLKQKCHITLDETEKLREKERGKDTVRDKLTIFLV